MSVPYARFFTPPLRGGSFPLPRAKDVVKTSVFTRPLKRDSSTLGHVLPDEAVGVLGSAALPRVMGCSESLPDLGRQGRS